MQHVLLLGAGFSRNWGGWLATEAFEYLLGTSEVQRDDVLRALLWKHQREGGFEDAIAELQGLVRRDPRDPEGARLSDLLAAVLRMFSDMNAAMAASDWDFMPFVGNVSMGVGPFLAKFDAIFTLNQDLLLEHRYVRNVMAWGSPRIQSAALPGMTRLRHENDPGNEDSWALSTWVAGSSFEVGPKCQPIYKLHGSTNWRVSSGDPMVIIGGEKASGIAKSDVLSVYAREFERRLSMGARLMVIGYGFRDLHINATLDRAAANGLRLFVVDPLGSGLADSLNGTRRGSNVTCSTGLEILFEKTLVGASRRTLRETFGLDGAEYKKLMGFFDK